ncbi:MAG: hypothetical protein OEP48_10275 [Betaproteobacteria bacterium]|nr:hypothetical protein [Betaproteobacteria bacterium]MDH3435606.1 hypothetical protein [Betaproteobacteria bacterium]
MKRGEERSIGQVPKPVRVLLAAALVLQIGWQALQPKPIARAEALSAPPTAATLGTLAFGEPIAFAALLTLHLQAFDNQPGISIPFAQLDYGRVGEWLDAILRLDPVSQYPLLMAAQLYGQIPDPTKQRQMCELVRRQFEQDPNRRWRWLAHCAIMAKHRLRDTRLALAYAEAIARSATQAPTWARQMRIFVLENMGEAEAAAILLGGLLVSGEVTDPQEIHFLTERLKQLKGADKSSRPSEK